MPFTQQEMQQLLIDVITNYATSTELVTVLTAGADPNGAVTKGLRPLHYATHENNVACMEVLVKFGADVNLDDDVGYTALHIATKHGYHQAVDFLLTHGAVVDYTNPQSGKVSEKTENLAQLGVHPLNSALENNHPKCAELLLDHGCDPNHKYFMGHVLNLVPLENLECLEVLLKHGANPDLVSRGGLSTLMKACRTQYFDAAQLLIKYKANVDLECVGQFDQKRALHYAVESGDIEICRLLLECGADTSIPPNHKFSPLEVAVTLGKEAICDLLLVHGAKVNEINSEDCIPLQVACTTAGLSSQNGIIATLLKHGADPLYSSPTISCIGPCLTSLVEYISSNDRYDVIIITTLIQYGAYVNFTIPSKNFIMRDPFGILPQVNKIQVYEGIFDLLLSCAKVFDRHAIGMETSLSDTQRQELLGVRSLKRLCRHAVRGVLRAPGSVSALPLPLCLMTYLQFRAQ